MEDREQRPRRPQREGWEEERYGGRGRECAFCTNRGSYVDYKNVEVLRPYVTEHGRIRPRRRTGACAKHQRQVAIAIKRARHLALLPCSHTHTWFSRG